ncbi:MAG: Rieske 2Fe-2S domain-containing protein [Dokdonella sp.]
MNNNALCRLEDISDGGATAIDTAINGEEWNLILLRRGGQVYAYHNVCSHAGRRLDYAPGQFLVRGESLICAAHGATFDVCSGLCRGGPGGGGLTPVAIRVDDGAVILDREPASAAAECTPEA